MNEDIISKNLDKTEILYLRNKHKGGSNNRKGADYENCFMTFKILESSSIHRDHIPQVKIQDQIFCYVDDLRIETPIETGYFQLKNSNKTYWGTKNQERTITTDFKGQFNLSKTVGEQNPKTTLVVSCKENKKKLFQSIPDAIVEHTKVFYFPDTKGSFNQLITEDYEGVKDMLRSITMVENATDDVLEGTFSSLLIAKKSSENITTVEEALSQASKLYPTQVRPFPMDQNWLKHLLPGFTEILDDISGLVYGTERGVFHWKCYGMSGVFGYPVTSDIFKKFQEQIINNPPTDYEEFEEALP